MDKLSDYELRVLRQMATGENPGIVNGAALWRAVETLQTRGLIEARVVSGTVFYGLSKAGNDLVRARALDELMANDAELTETNNGHR